MLQEKSYIRQSLLSSLLDVAKYNISKKNKNIMFYEIANTYSEKDEYIEDTKLAFILSGNYISNDWNNLKYNMDYYFLKGVIENLLDFLGLKDRYSLNLSKNVPKEIHPKINSEIIIQGKSIGYIGKLHPMVARDDIYVCELSLTKLLEFKSSDVKYKELNKYPVIEKDLAFIVSKETESFEIQKEIKKSGGKLLSNVKVFDIYTGENIGNDKKSIAYSLTFEDYSKTLTEEEVMKVFNKIIIDIKSKFNAELRDK
jgi:phenylalanyl-tRNA synthetase beta chain